MCLFADKIIWSAKVTPAFCFTNLKGHMDGFEETGLAQIFGTMSQQFVAATSGQPMKLLEQYEQEITALKIPEGEALLALEGTP